MATDSPRPRDFRSAAGPPFPLVDQEGGQVWQMVKDGSSPLATRIAALEELIARRDPALPRYLLDELERERERDDLPTAWRDHVIFAAEDVDFLEEADRTRLRARLFDLADRMCDPAKAPGNPEALWSAVRRFTSLISPDLVEVEVQRLLRFLRAGGPLLLHQATLQAVQNLFAAAPPECPKAIEQLRRRAAELAKQFLIPDIVSSPSNAALAINAVHSLAVLGDRHLGDVIRQVCRLNKRWMADQLCRRLEEVREHWGIHATDFRSRGETNPWEPRARDFRFQSGAYDRLCDAIAKLKTPSVEPLGAQPIWGRAIEAIGWQRVAVAASLAALVVGFVAGNLLSVHPQPARFELMAAHTSPRPSEVMKGAADSALTEVSPGRYGVKGEAYYIEIRSPVAGKVTLAQFEWDRKPRASKAMIFPRDTQRDIETDAKGYRSFGPLPAPKRPSALLVVVCLRTARDVVGPFLERRSSFEGFEQLLISLQEELARAGVTRAAVSVLYLEPVPQGNDSGEEDR